ncbi:hypothetical protein ACFZB2_39490 [Streptomyces bobili]|uniref:hypothetical protein n=1 Tax=Streptomyces bobili TaxID=67280 RepID=UPI0036E1B4F4
MAKTTALATAEMTAHTRRDSALWQIHAIPGTRASPYTQVRITAAVTGLDSALGSESDAGLEQLHVGSPIRRILAA